MFLYTMFVFFFFLMKSLQLQTETHIFHIVYSSVEISFELLLWSRDADWIFSIAEYFRGVIFLQLPLYRHRSAACFGKLKMIEALRVLTDWLRVCPKQTNYTSSNIADTAFKVKELGL